MAKPPSDLASELRSGTFIFAVLSLLEQEQYGYALHQSLKDCGIEIEQSTLYPLLRRLESQGFLESRWSTEGSQPRRYYRLTPSGRAALQALRREWRVLAASFDRLLGKGGNHDVRPS